MSRGLPRRYLSYSNVVATLALFFALAGGALAANHYLINSTRQINPKVLKTLRGATGPTFSAHVGPEFTPGGEEPIRNGTVAKLEVNLPRAGKLALRGSFYGLFKCTVNSCPYIEMSLVLDGKQVPHSSLLIGYLPNEATAPEKGDAQFTTTGRASVAGGHHTIELEVTQKNPSGVVEALKVGEDSNIDATLTG